MEEASAEDEELDGTWYEDEKELVSSELDDEIAWLLDASAELEKGDGRDGTIWSAQDATMVKQAADRRTRPSVFFIVLYIIGVVPALHIDACV